MSRSDPQSKPGLDAQIREQMSAEEVHIAWLPGILWWLLRRAAVARGRPMREVAAPGVQRAWWMSVAVLTTISAVIAWLWTLPQHSPDPYRQSPFEWGVGLAIGWGIASAYVAIRCRSQRSLAALLVGAALVRLPLLLVEPAWSDDLYRYRWEGHVQLEGVNPYVVAPSERPDLDPLAEGDAGATPLLDLVNHSHLPTIYPPAAEILFALGALVGAAKSSTIAKLLLVLAELTMLAIVHHWGGRRWRAWGVAPFMALHPLFTLEVAGGGHLDILVVLWMSVFFIAWRRRLAGLAGAALALATATKLLPIVLLPYALLQRRRGRGRFLVAFASLLTLLYLPYAATAGAQVFGSLGTYTLKWEANAVVFPLIETAVDRTGLAAALDRATWRPDGEPQSPFRALLGFHPEARHAQQVAKRIAALIGAVIAAWLFWLAGAHRIVEKRNDRKTKPPLSLESIAFVLFASVIVLSPVVYPWYLLMLFPMLATRNNSGWRWAAVAAPILYTATGYLSVGAFAGIEDDPALFGHPLVVFWGYTLVWIAVRPVLARYADRTEL